MKRALTGLLLLVSSLTATAADAPTLTGKWQIHISIANRESDSTCTFAQTGDDLAGSCTGPRGVNNFTGKINDKKVTWSYKSESEAGTITLKYRGAVQSATSMSGFVNVEEFGVEGSFTATQGK